jgi:hypothetical protein
MADDLLLWNVPPVADVDMAPAEDSPSAVGVASFRPSASSSGKSMLGTGGGSGKLVNLVVVNRNSSCLGYIGNSRSKICLGPKDCGTKAHERDQYVFPEEVQDLVFIDAGGSNPAAWAAPSVELSWFGATWDRYRNEVRHVTQWQTLLEAMSSGQSFTEQDVNRMAEATRTAKEMFTPFKKKRKPDEDEASWDGSVSSYQDVKVLGYSPLKTSNDIPTQMKAIGQNMEWLWKMALAAKKGNDEIEETIADVLTRLEARIGELRALIGTRAPELGTASVFSLVEAHTEGLKEVAELWEQLANQIARVSAPKLPDMDLFKVNLKKEVYGDMNGALAPLRALFSKHSTHINSPGDRLDVEMNKFRQEVARLDRQLQQQSFPVVTSPPGVPNNLAWNVAVGQTGSTPFSGPTPSASPLGGQALNPDLKALEKKILRLERLLDARAVKIGTKTFATRQEAEAWLNTSCTSPGGYTFFVDFHSLLALAFGAGGTMADVLKLQETTVKLSFASIDEAIVYSSFHLEIPSFFGKPSTGATMQSAKVLPGLQTYAAWDSGDGDHGLRYDMKQKVMGYADTWRTSAEYNLGPEALVVAQTMLHNAVAFVDKVSYWITEFFTDCRNKGANDGETWKHISHTIREVCNILHDARKAGRGHYSTAKERAACAFWGQLQAQREMEVLSQRSLVADPRLSHILNLHLRDNAVMRSELAAVHETMKNIQKDISDLKKANSRRPVAGPGAAGRAAARQDQE